MQRIRRFFSHLLLIAALFFSLPLSAQKTLDDTQPLNLFNKGLELYQNKHFGSAQSIFKDYLKVASGQNHLLKIDAEYYIALSAMELFQNDAEALLTDFTLKYPESPKARMVNYYLGRFMFRQKDYANALDAFSKVEVSDLNEKDKYEFIFMNGYANFKQDKFVEAKSYFGQLKDVPNENQVLGAYYYGYISYNEGDYKSALQEFTKIKDDKKFKSVVPVYITQIYLLQKKYDKVIETGEASLADKTTEMSEQVKLYVAEAYFMKKNYAKAVEYFQEFGTSYLNETQQYELGYSYYQLEQYELSVQAFNNITIKEDSLGQNVTYNLGNAYLKLSQREKARNAYDFAYKLNFDPGIRELSLFNYAKLSYELNFQKEAIEAFKVFLRSYPNSKYGNEAKEVLSNILLATNSPKDAKDILETIPNKSDRLSEAYQKVLYLYGMELFNNGQYAEAMTNYRNSLKQPFDRKIRALCFFWLGESQYRTKDYQGAIENYKNFLYVGESKQTPYYNVAFYNIGYGYFKKEDYMNASTYFKQYLNLESNSKRTARTTDAYLRLADANFVLKDYSTATALYNSVLTSKSPESDYALYQLGIVQGLNGNSEGKISTLRNLAKTYPNSPYVDDALYEIGRTYIIKGDFQQAIKEFNNLNYNYPKNPYLRIAMLNIGQSYINMSQDNNAVQVFKNIVKLYPFTDEARQATKAIENSYIDRGLTDSLNAFYASMPNKSLTASSLDSSLYASALSNVKRGDCEAAVSAFDKYLEKYPSGYFAVDASFYEAECQYKLKMYNQAQNRYNYVIAKSPNQFVERSLLVSADLYFKDKNYKMALSRYTQLEDVAANRQNVLVGQMGAMRSNFLLGDFDKTIAMANKVLQLSFADEASKQEAQFYLAKSQLELHQYDQALAGFTSVYQNNKSEIGAESMYQVANIQFLTEKYIDAQKTIFDLKDRYAFYDYWRAKGFILLADIYLKTGDAFQAKSTLQSIIDNYEGDELRNIAKEKLKAIKDAENKGNK